jgi:protein NrfD
MTGNLEVVTSRHNPLIDPRLAVWGWEIPVYLFLGGLVAGLLVLGALCELSHPDRPRSRALRLMPFAALGLLSLGMLALFSTSPTSSTSTASTSPCAGPRRCPGARGS